jgi:hypothetical protein
LFHDFVNAVASHIGLIWVVCLLLMVMKAVMSARAADALQPRHD